eukprot:GFYU01013174.1.p1 GENE.GFYU01013174.1~~GFYU01013174.1.p1  ORF type:complete len:102 (+),score=10.95 GFYU01013174.1:1-306(+)
MLYTMCATLFTSDDTNLSSQAIQQLTFLPRVLCHPYITTPIPSCPSLYSELEARLFHVITGRGVHSANQRARILPAVKEALTKEGYRYYEKLGVVYINPKM